MKTVEKRIEFIITLRKGIWTLIYLQTWKDQKRTIFRGSDVHVKQIEHVLDSSHVRTFRQRNCPCKAKSYYPFKSRKKGTIIYGLLTSIFVVVKTHFSKHEKKLATIRFNIIVDSLHFVGDQFSLISLLSRPTCS